MRIQKTWQKRRRNAGRGALIRMLQTARFEKLYEKANGFFFEGKLSDTLKDELYLENRKNAELKAYRTGFVLLFFVIWAMGVGIFSSVKACAAFMLISISLIYAFVLFYSNYLLYRFEKEE